MNEICSNKYIRPCVNGPPKIPQEKWHDLAEALPYSGASLDPKRFPSVTETVDYLPLNSLTYKCAKNVFLKIQLEEL